MWQRFKEAIRYYDPCPDCKKPDISAANLRKLKILCAGGTVAIGACGAVALPIAGFGSAGVSIDCFIKKFTKINTNIHHATQNIGT